MASIKGRSAADLQVILMVLRSPMRSLDLSVHRGELIYGFIGIGGAIIGFILWGLALLARMGSLFNGLVPWGVFFSTSGWTSNLFLMSIVSTLLFLGSISLFGYFLGSHKAGLLQMVTTLGSVQLIAGAGFLVSAVVTLIVPSLGWLLLILTFVVNLIMTYMTALELFDVHSADGRYYVVLLSMATYLIITAVVFASMY